MCGQTVFDGHEAVDEFGRRRIQNSQRMQQQQQSQYTARSSTSTQLEHHRVDNSEVTQQQDQSQSTVESATATQPAQSIMRLEINRIEPIRSPDIPPINITTQSTPSSPEFSPVVREPTVLRPTPGNVTARRQRARINEVLSPRVHRYRDSYARSGSFPITSVDRGIHPQERTVELLENAEVQRERTNRLLEDIRSQGE